MKRDYENGCSRCGQYRRVLDARVTTLIGGYHAELCVPCSNAWHEYVVPLADYALRNDLDIEEAAHVAGARFREAVEAARALRVVDARLYELGKAWVNDHPPDPEAS